ncbi:hypothetical protein ASALC70_01661 [Alcanivorax sp. ALC70]|nr:hypothetical protein ASALC70_01661 [Alcanivorax sp. ALC70]
MVGHGDLEFRLGTAHGAHRPVELVDAVGVVGVVQVGVGETAGDGVGIQGEQAHQRAAVGGFTLVVLEVAIRHFPAVGEASVEVGVVHLEFTARVAGAVTAHIAGVVVVAEHHVEGQLHRLEGFLELLRELGIVDTGDAGLIDVVAQPHHEIATGPLGLIVGAGLGRAHIGDRLAHGEGAVGAAAGIAHGDETHPLQHGGLRFRLLGLLRLLRFIGFRGLITAPTSAAATSATGGQGQPQGGGQGQPLVTPVHAVSSRVAGTGGCQRAVRRVRGRDGRSPSSRNRLSPS